MNLQLQRELEECRQAISTLAKHHPEVKATFTLEGYPKQAVIEAANLLGQRLDKPEGSAFPYYSFTVKIGNCEIWIKSAHLTYKVQEVA